MGYSIKQYDIKWDPLYNVSNGIADTSGKCHLGMCHRSNNWKFRLRLHEKRSKKFRLLLGVASTNSNY